MSRIIAAIALIAIFGGGIYYYFHYKNGQNPARVYEHALALPGVASAQNYLTDKVKNWKPDPEDPAIRIPQNWGKSDVTVAGKTFTAYSSDSVTPPRYYIAFAFPKSAITKVQVIKCWGTAKEKKTDVCIVGNNPGLDAYFQILKLLKVTDFSNFVPKVEMTP